MFDQISSSYDLLNHILSLSVDDRWREKAIDGLSASAQDLVLDVASGTGDMAIKARARTGCSVVGIDLSPRMLHLATEKWGSENATYIPIVGDALQMPFPDSAFDKAMVSFGIRNMVNIEAFLDEMHRVLRPEGRLAIVELSIPEEPVVKQLYMTYLTTLLPFLGGVLSGEREAYDYLSTSIQMLPSPHRLRLMFVDHGFEVVSSMPMTFGICHLYILARR